jgi:hypothetical protein
VRTVTATARPVTRPQCLRGDSDPLAASDRLTEGQAQRFAWGRFFLPRLMGGPHWLSLPVSTPAPRPTEVPVSAASPMMPQLEPASSAFCS